MDYTISIEGMSCSHCVSTVEKLVKEYTNGGEINVSLENKNVEVSLTTVPKIEIIEKINTSTVYKAS